MKQVLEQLIRDGNHKEVERRLFALSVSKIPRADALSLANVARRINRPEWALRILNPIVREPHPPGGPATPEEKIEYANSLRKLGAVPEAAEILTGIDSQKFPQVKLHLALCCFAQWQYTAAIPMLRDYVGSLAEGSYAWSVGQVNLASALITVDAFAEASKILSKLLLATRSEEAKLLHSNCLELKAQIEILYQKDWSAALETLASARRLLESDDRSAYALFVDKWRAVAVSLRDGKVAPELDKVRGRAIQLMHWETVRDCDLYEAQLNHDHQSLLRIYFGTPHESLRSRIRRESPDLLVPESYLWSASREKPRSVFDLGFATIDDAKTDLVVGQLPHQFLILLARDFYRPVPLLSAFSSLHSDEHFNPTTSPNRIHQLVRRLRTWFEEESLPLRLEEQDGSYKLSFDGSASKLALRIPREPLPLDSFELELRRLRSCVNSEVFTNKDVVTLLGASRASVQRLLKRAMNEKKVAATAGGRSAKYKFVS